MGNSIHSEGRLLIVRSKHVERVYCRSSTGLAPELRVGTFRHSRIVAALGMTQSSNMYFGPSIASLFSSRGGLTATALPALPK